MEIEPLVKAPIDTSTKAERLRSRKKNIRKMIGLITKHREQGLRELADDYPFLIIDEDAIGGKTPDDLIEELRQLYRSLKEDYELEVYFSKYGSTGMKQLRDKSKEKLVELGLDPDE